MDNTQIAGLVEALPLPALVIDLSNQICAANQGVNSILGERLTGRHYIHTLRQPAIIEAIETCKATREKQSTQYLGTEGRNETTYDLSCAYIAGEDEQILVTFTDVTDLKLTDQLRSDFVANVSHELRTPLTALMGFIETLQTTAKDDAKASARFLGIMASETSRMNRLVDDLLSLSRVEAQGRARPTQTLDIADLLRSTVHSLTPLAQNTEAELTLDAQAPPVPIFGDTDQLRQVFVNLIENALKYGGNGVKVDVSLAAETYEPQLRCMGVRVRVRDTGVGFDPIHIPRMTERFYRIDSHRSREMGGTGLGLAITKHIINRHRGRLEISSAIGQGSEFAVILPTERAF